jgi:diguanylate cyclase (GGDEF)-like protein
MSTVSADIASYVLETCIKLQNPDDFQEAMKEVCADVRDLCDSEHCCILLMDTEKRKCSVLCEAFSKDTDLLPMDKYVDDAFYDIAYSWLDTIGGSNCLIVKNEHDMDLIKERNPIWHNSITSAGGKTIVLFPLTFKDELLGFMWAINFSDDKALMIKETLELTSFILASELYSYRMIEHLRYMSYTDALTKLPNRFASSDYVADLIKRNEKFTVVSIDLNNFKSVNDTLGFKAGNKVLIEISRRWKAVSEREGSESREYMTRINGDEFLLIIYGYSNDDELRSAVARYADALTDHLTVDGCDLYITASFGYAEYPTDADTADSLISHANLAMNEIKKDTAFFSGLIKKTGLDLTLSLNASARHLMKNGFVEEIRDLIESNDINPDQLDVEITESILIDSADKALQCINELRDMGVKLAIDDFGTGYSSLSYLNKIPANLLKIDKSFIDKINANESSKQYVAAIISMGHIMGLDVISEGVEEEEQLEALRSIGCDYVQGYIWGRPMMPDAAEELVMNIVKL